MKKIAIISVLILATAFVFTGCGDKRSPGRIYMPDMAYSRAFETYAPRNDSFFTMDPAMLGKKIFYNNLPPLGTIKRGELFPFNVPNDSNGLLVLSSQVKNPLPLHAAGAQKHPRGAGCHGPGGRQRPDRPGP